jgi:predicted negative regulator of RcsB-dependent stress response
MEASERFMETKGRWLGAVILLAAAAFVGWNAFGVMPRG